MYHYQPPSIIGGTGTSTDRTIKIAGDDVIPESVLEPSLWVKMAASGVASCMADAITFPLDTAKVRLQLQGEGGGAVGQLASGNLKYRGLGGTLLTMTRQEGARSLYNGLAAGLQRQMCFASIRIGFYDDVKGFYQRALLREDSAGGASLFVVRILAALTTGGAAVFVAQPTDVVKVRMQAQSVGTRRYDGCADAYRKIAHEEGVKGLWKGLLPNVARNAVINVAEIVCYDVTKDAILSYRLMKDNVPCHFVSAVAAGFCATVCASPVDVVKTRYMNSRSGHYRSAVHCAVVCFREGGVAAFYKGFVPNFTRIVSWNICMWTSYEQLKRLIYV